MTKLFDDNAQDPSKQEEITAVQTPDYSDLLAGIKNERGEQKFKSVEDLVNGYTTSQEFIGTLKGEKSTVESQLQELSGKVKSQEELQELLQAPKTEEQAPTPQVPAGLKAEDVVQILEQQEAQKVADSNVISVKEAVKAVKGDLKALTEEAGLSPTLAQKMAQDSPAALLKLLGVEAPKAPTPDLSSSVTTSFNNNNQQPVKTVMRSSKSSDLVDAWKAAGQRAEARLTEEGSI